MKKIITILIMAMLIISFAPFAVAKNDKITTGATETIPKQGPVSIKESQENIKERIEATKTYKIARLNTEQAKEKYLEAKQTLSQAKTRVREECASDGEGCVEIKKEIKLHSKDFLISSSDKVLNYLEKLKEKTEASENLDEDVKQETLAKIEGRITEFEEERENVEDLDENSSDEEIKQAVLTIQNRWKKAQDDAKLSVGRLANAKIHGIIVKSEQLEIKLDRIMTKLEEKGYDTSSTETLVNEFKAKIDQAKGNYDIARAKYDEIEGSGRVNEIMKEANSFMRAAHQNLKEAHVILKQILREIKATAEGEVEEEETKVEVSGDVELSSETQATLDSLVASFKGVEGKIELKLKIKKKDNITEIEKDEVEGTLALTDEQNTLWEQLKEQAFADVEAAEGDDIEIEIEIEHELKIEEESEEEIEIEVKIEDGVASIKVEFNATKMEFQLETTDIDEIVAEIVARTGLSEEVVYANLKLEIEEEKDEDKIEIEVEIEDGKAEVEVEFGTTDMEFELNTTDVDEIVAEIVARTGLDEEIVRANLEVETEDDDESDDEDDD